MKKIILSAFVLAAAFMSSCNDDTTVDNGNGNNTEEKTCRIATIDDNDGFVTALTYDGENLVKMTETDSSEVVTYDFNYTGGKLMSIVNDIDEKWEMTYTGDNVTKMEYYDEMELIDVFDISYNAEGNPTKMDISSPDGMGTELYSTYEMTWNNGNLSAIIEYEIGENGQVEDTFATNLTAYDDKVNYLSRTPLWLIEYDNYFAYSKNNVTAGNVDFMGTPIPLSLSWKYDADGKAEEVNFSFFQFATTLNFTYDCQ
jgi:YD repeat-containing protein